MQQVSQDSVALKILNSYLQNNENTTDTVYDSLNKVEAFFENENKQSLTQSQITQYFVSI
jgi:hypothetical protein